MTNHKNLSSLPPATLRAALEESEERVRREKEKVQKKIRRLQNRLDKLEQGEYASEQEVEPEKKIASGSQRREKRPRVVDSSSDEENTDEWRERHWPIAKARKLNHGPASFQGKSCTRCQKKGIECKWDWGTNATSRSCVPCKSQKKGCDLKRPPLERPVRDRF